MCVVWEPPCLKNNNKLSKKLKNGIEILVAQAAVSKTVTILFYP